VPERVRDLPPGSSPRSRVSPLWPIVMVVVGVLWLSASLGGPNALPTLASLLMVWPVVLIGVGVDMLSGGRYRLPVLGATVVLALLWWTVAGIRGAGERSEVLVPLDGAQRASLTMQLAASGLQIDASAPAGVLMQGVLELARGEHAQPAVVARGEWLNVRLESTSIVGGVSSWRGPRNWQLSLSPAVPIDLAVRAGVGRSELDLRALTLLGLDFAGGVGEAIFQLPARGGYQGSLDLGVGATTVDIPAGLEAQLVVRAGVGRVSVQGAFDRDGDRYTTPGFAIADASERIELAINGGVGAVTVHRAP